MRKNSYNPVQLTSHSTVFPVIILSMLLLLFHSSDKVFVKFRDAAKYRNVKRKRKTVLPKKNCNQFFLFVVFFFGFVESSIFDLSESQSDKK